MLHLIACDDGHGLETAGKRTPAFSDGTVIRENQFNSAVAKLFAEEMKRCGCETIFTAPTDADTSLSARVKTANNAKADLFISFHFNAFTGTWESSKGGVSTHYYKNSTKSKKLAELVQAELIKGTVQENRGIVPGSLYVCKYTDMPTVLIEAGFMDVTKEAELMLDVNFQKEVAIEAAVGVCKYLGIPYVEEVQPQPVPKETINQEVLELQKTLNRLKITDGKGNKLEEDGKCGSRTKEAVKRIQSVSGITVDGSAGAQTMEVINQILSKPTTKRGEKGVIVRYIQFRVGATIDGSFGPATEKSIKKWQGKNGLVQDGSVGPATWTKLFN
jgi:N-acetylmuramoyl-L-alanine amidase